MKSMLVFLMSSYNYKEPKARKQKIYVPEILLLLPFENCHFPTEPEPESCQNRALFLSKPECLSVEQPNVVFDHQWIQTLLVICSSSC